MSTTYRLGVDVGGTFTDGVLVDESTGQLRIDKVLTTPVDPSQGFLRITQRLGQRARLSPATLRYIMHATTTATNAVLERRGARTALLITRGFRDVLEIARQVRHELYNLQTDKPPPLVPRRLCLEIPERLNYRGEVQLPLDEAAVEAAVERLRALGVESIAICFLHAYRNAAHEQRAAEIIRRLWPDVTLSLSSEIAPEIREYWRASTTVVNAYVAPVVRRYLDGISHRLHAEQINTDVHVMQSNGGVTTAAVARERPVYLIESGPAAGVRMAAAFAEFMGFRNAISFDMGGTTAKMGLIRDGQPKVLPEFEVGAGSFSGTGLVKGSGYPIVGAVMDLVEVGAGGGSLGWVDSGGLLRVGPRSAGADPGPACYGRGGDEPTITDANLLLGRLNPDYFLGGDLKLDCAAAQLAVERRCARPLGIGTVQAARGIVEIANATMGQAVRLVSVQRGYDPREFCLVAFGGAGPVHANRLAADLGIPLILVPPSPGVASAWGLLMSDLRHDYRATRTQPLADARLDEINGLLHEFECAALATLAREGVQREQARLERYLDVRYIGQSWKLTVKLPNGSLTAADLQSARLDFDRLHEATYGYAVPEEPAELVNVGLLATGPIPKASLHEVQSGGSDPVSAQRANRPVYFDEAGGFVDCAVYDRYALLQGNVVAGPAIIEEVDSSTVVHPGYSAAVGRYGVLLIRAGDQRTAVF